MVLAHNASVVGGYLAHRWLAAFETDAERFFMNVVLVRVLYAHALVLDAGLALGRFSFLGRVFGLRGRATAGIACYEKRSARCLSDH